MPHSLKMVTSMVFSIFKVVHGLILGYICHPLKVTLCSFMPASCSTSLSVAVINTMIKSNLGTARLTWLTVPNGCLIIRQEHGRTRRETEERLEGY